MRFEEPEYTFEENSGTGEVCLIKDLATPDSVTVQVTTTDITATGKPHQCTYNNAIPIFKQVATRVLFLVNYK